MAGVNADHGVLLPVYNPEPQSVFALAVCGQRWPINARTGRGRVAWVAFEPILPARDSAHFGLSLWQHWNTLFGAVDCKRTCSTTFAGPAAILTTGF